jgi:hypothetical protein
VGFEPTIPVFKWTKAVDAVDRQAAVLGLSSSLPFRTGETGQNYIKSKSGQQVYIVIRT